MQDLSWISLHIYCNQDPNPILLEHIVPYIKSNFQKKIVNKFFFIRYSDPRLHIRLRVKVSNSYRNQVIKELQRIFIDSRLVPYVPEVKRYGGNEAILVAEDEFQLSSFTTLNKLQDSYSKTVYAALYLHLAFLMSLEVNHEDLKEMLHFLLEDRVIKNIKHTPSQNKLLQNKQLVMNYLRDTWKIFISNKKSTDTHIWMEQTNIIYHRLLKLQEKGKLKIPPCPYLIKVYGIDKSRYVIWHILGDYMHLTNNRLGVQSNDESLLLDFLYELF